MGRVVVLAFEAFGEDGGLDSVVTRPVALNAVAREGPWLIVCLDLPPPPTSRRVEGFTGLGLGLEANDVLIELVEKSGSCCERECNCRLEECAGRFVREFDPNGFFLSLSRLLDDIIAMGTFAVTFLFCPIDQDWISILI